MPEKREYPGEGAECNCAPGTVGGAVGRIGAGAPPNSKTSGYAYGLPLAELSNSIHEPG